MLKRESEKRGRQTTSPTLSEQETNALRAKPEEDGANTELRRGVVTLLQNVRRGARWLALCESRSPGIWGTRTRILEDPGYSINTYYPVDACRAQYIRCRRSSDERKACILFRWSLRSLPIVMFICCGVLLAMDATRGERE
jgi:hypothetical protein